MATREMETPATPPPRRSKSHEVKATVAPGTVLCLNYQRKRGGTNEVIIEDWQTQMRLYLSRNRDKDGLADTAC